MPENTLKFGVGVMLSSFGVFWTGEGLGIDWPGQDLALFVFAALFLAVGLMATAWVRRPDSEAGTMTLVKDIISELFGMFVGDARLTVAVLAVVAIAGVLSDVAHVGALVSGGVLLIGILCVVVEAVRHAARDR